MKQIIFLLFISANVFGQDSTKIKISIQARDAKYISATNSKDDEELFFDAVKPLFRVAPGTLPGGATLVSVDSIYTGDWLRIYNKLNSDQTALKSGTKNRLETILRAVNQTYLTGKLNDIDAADIQTFQTMQQVGLIKFRRF